MANENNVSSLVSQAWQHHREGQTSAALTAFEKIVQQHPQDIDAHYGLGLAQKAVGQTAAAINTFKHTLEIISTNQKKEDTNRNLEIESVKTPEDDRLMMLQRMVKQRLAETQNS